MVFLFPNDDALHFALTGGLVPPAVSLAPARIGRDTDGRAWVAPAVAVPRALPAVLRRAGIEWTATPPTSGHEVAHWLEALPLRRDRVPPALTDQTPVLFELRDAAGLTPLVSEMLRLGNDRQAYRLFRGSALSTQHSALLKVIGPPYYALLRALDPIDDDAPRAYLERAPRFWVEVGWTHPLLHQIKPPEGQLVFLRPPADWTVIADGPFADVYDALDFQIPSRSADWNDDPAVNLRVPLRLVPGSAAEPAEMWVLRGAAVDQIDALVRGADDRLLARLAFAIGDHEGERIAVLRVRPGKTAPPVLELEGALACRPYLRLPSLYLPVGSRLRPPLRRDTVRRLLAEDLDQVVWLTPQDGDSFVPQVMPEAALRPLGDWANYVMERDAAALSAWVGAARFEFGTSIGSDDSAQDVRPNDRQLKLRGAAAAVAEAAKARVKPTKTKPNETEIAPPVEPFKVIPAATPSELQVRLKAAEEQFLAIDGPLDDPRRMSLWPELARLNSRLDRPADASLAWASALWEQPDLRPDQLWSWVEAEHALAKPELTAADLDRWLANHQPVTSDVRPLAAVLAWASRCKPAPAELLRRLPEVQRYLEQHEHLLPVRALWLAWQGLTCHHSSVDAPTANNDVLTLARVRDRLLERLLTDGLGAERDLPGFLRFAGEREGDRLRSIRDGAERLRQLAHSWSGFPAGDGMQQTAAYVDLLFAFGFARLGNVGAAQNLVRTAGPALAASGSEAHTFLLEAFRYRIDQAIAGKPHAGPLPTEQLEYLDQMRREADAQPKDDLTARLPPYAVERMKEQSLVLDPQEKFDPYRRIKHEPDHLIRDLVRLIDVHDRALISKGVRRITDDAAKNPRLAETRLSVLAESLALASRVGEALTAELLAQVVPALNAISSATAPTVVEKQARLLERALLFAAHYGIPNLVRSCSERLVHLVKAPAGRGALEPLGRLVGQTFRSLRKLGLKEQTEQLLHQVTEAALGGQSLDQARANAGHEWQPKLRLLLNLAAGWLYFDRPDQARPILDVGRAWIRSPEKKAIDRPALQYVPLVCAYITAVGQTPQDEALARIEELFAAGAMDRLPNTFTTSPFYSRFHLNIVEAVVMTLATDDFALGPAARRWLDDDEYLVRRRIHRDVRTALAGAGM